MLRKQHIKKFKKRGERKNENGSGIFTYTYTKKEMREKNYPMICWFSNQIENDI